MYISNAKIIFTINMSLKEINSFNFSNVLILYIKNGLYSEIKRMYPELSIWFLSIENNIFPYVSFEIYKDYNKITNYPGDLINKSFEDIDIIMWLNTLVYSSLKDCNEIKLIVKLWK